MVGHSIMCAESTAIPASALSWGDATSTYGEGISCCATMIESASARRAGWMTRSKLQVVEADGARQATLIAEGDVDCALCRALPVLAAGWSFTPFGRTGSQSSPIVPTP